MRTQRREAKLRDLFESYSTPVLAYSLRHVGPAAAQDVVSDVFLVAWRRIDDVPHEALPWLLVVARNTIRNSRRGTVRQERLADRLAGLERSSATLAAGAEEVAVERRAMFAALVGLSPFEREAVLLTAWDGLPAAQAAQVAGCSRRAFEIRLNRARSRLRRALATDDQPARALARPKIVQESSL